MGYKLGIIGYGGMGSWHHKRIKEKVKEIDVIAAYDIRPERLEEAERNGLKAYSTTEPFWQ